MDSRPKQSPDEQEIIDFIEHGPELAEAREFGVDLWALWANLQRTPEERIRRHQAASIMADRFFKILRP